MVMSSMRWRFGDLFFGAVFNAAFRGSAHFGAVLAEKRYSDAEKRIF
jgi:hypothetical protein